MNNKVLAGLGVLVAVAFIWFFGQNRSTPAPTPTPSPTPVSPNPTSIQPVPTELSSVEIVMTDAGYTPSEVTIKKGSTITFVNSSSKARWPASAPHPTHTDYPEFDPKKAVSTGQSWSFTFDKVGTWNWHDHLQPTLRGKITVVE